MQTILVWIAVYVAFVVGIYLTVERSVFALLGPFYIPFVILVSIYRFGSWLIS